MEGFSYVFLRKDGAPLPMGCAGHVGWGFTATKSANDIDAICGSTENTSGSAIVLPGHDIGYWDARVDHENQMFALFKKRGYHAFKKAKVPTVDADAALQMAHQQSQSGYSAIGNNCLDHTFRILEAYGVKGLPWPLNHGSPNEWFALFNGAYVDL